ncbi:MAG TPA: hypothetical protein VEL47_05500 [Myxococcota bacterium]|nr:hypothetical protein [Myxococcota bacterium]
MEKDNITSVQKSDRLVIPEAYIIDQLNEHNQKLWDLPELRLPDTYQDDDEEPVSTGHASVIIIDL